MTISYACRGCGDALRKATKTRRIVGCVACGALHDPAANDRKPERAPPAPDPQHDLEMLARFAPLLEGSSSFIIPSDQQPFIPATRIANGRPDAIDEESKRVRRAITALHRLEALLDLPDGRRHVLALGYVYYFCGPETRKLWAASGGIETRVGVVFGSPAQRRSWTLNPSPTLGERGAAEFGRAILAPAHAAYATLTHVSGERAAATGRLSIATLNDATSRFNCEAETALRELRAARERARCDRKKRAA